MDKGGKKVEQLTIISSNERERLRTEKRLLPNVI